MPDHDGVIPLNPLGLEGERSKGSVTNISFFYFSLITAIWGVVNYAFYNISDVNVAFGFLRLVLFLATWQAFFLFTLFYVFPDIRIKLPLWYKVFLIPIVV